MPSRLKHSQPRPTVVTDRGDNGETVETFTEKAIWELMYVGHTRIETLRRSGPAS
jgi:hypothetical protein